MASTSLRRQVDALRHASSGTSSGYIQRKKGRPSLLLTPDQAADVDLSSVRETAVMGLQRLEAVDQDFSPFQETLFSKEAESTLRDLQTKESNERIDQSIVAFLALLSPHFCSREAHFCLEYLIRHYKIYQYNVDAVVECCLPWHDTLAFARMVQLLSLKGSRWEFLTPVQKSGSPLPREAIARRCARDFGLLRFLCVSARRCAAAAAEASSRRGGSVMSSATADGRAKLFSFYAAVVVEALASLGSASEPLLRALVPTVVHGLSATRSPEYQMASYMILSALSGKGPLSPEVTGAALTALVCKPCQGGLQASLLCALAVVQTQVGFTTKKTSAITEPTLLPTLAFLKLSKMESLPKTLAGLAQKFDATAFLWLLLQSYVQHLPDEDGGHAASLTRLCLYPHWPVHSLPRLVRKLADRLIKSYLAITEEGFAAEGSSDEEAKEKTRRAEAVKSESQKVLRVLGQRFPHEVDAAVGKISRFVAKSKVAAAAAEDESDSAAAEVASRELVKDKALASLLASAFAGAELAQRMPLEEEELAVEGQESSTSSSNVHASVMVALEHPSGVVRARALEQLSCAISNAENTSEAEGGSGASEDLMPAVLQRLYDEDPQVVLAVSDNDVLLKQVLLRTTSANDEAKEDGPISSRATLVASAAVAAAGPWISALSEARPKYPVASAAQCLAGLIRVASAAVLSARERGESHAGVDDLSGEIPAEVSETLRTAMPLFLDCLPGPHANAHVKIAQQGLALLLNDGGDGGGNNTAGRSCKKAMRTVGRAAVKGVSVSVGRGGGQFSQLFFGLGDVFKTSATAAAGQSAAREKTGKLEKKRSSVLQGDDAMDVESAPSKGKGLKAMGEEVVDCLAAAFASASSMDELQALGEASGPGGRWLLMESTSRAVAQAEESTNLASLLASLATFELSVRPHAFSGEGESFKGVAAAGPADLLSYLQVCAGHLSRPQRPASLFSEDHLTSRPSPSSGNVVVSPLIGDVLVSVLTAAFSSPVFGGSGAPGGAVSEAIGSVVLHGYGRRPLSALAAIAIVGVSAEVDRRRPQSREERRGVVDEDSRVVSAARALCVAATFVKAEAAVKDGREEDLAAVRRDVVAVFPAALLAVTSEEKELRESGLLFIATVAAHGEAFCDTVQDVKSPSKGKAGRKSTPKGGGVVDLPVEDSDIFPLATMEGVAIPSVLRAPSLSDIVELATFLSERNRESVLGGPELSRHLASVLGDKEPSPDFATTADLDETTKVRLPRYLVAWAARLGWKDPSSCARLLECLSWAKLPMRECCLPLLRHCLDLEDAGNFTVNARLLKLLLRVTLASPGLDTAANANKSTPRTSPPQELFPSPEAEALFHRALRTPGQVQSFALEALSATGSTAVSGSGAGAHGTRQRRDLLSTLVEVGLDDGDGVLIAAAARALPAQPMDIAALVAALVGTEKRTSTSSPSPTNRKSGTAKAEGWVVTLGAIVELTQGLCNPAVTSSSASDSADSPYGKKRRTASDKIWSSAAPLELARPLFDVLPDLLVVVRSACSPEEDGQAATKEKKGKDFADENAASAEYALWLTMDVLGSVLGRSTKEGGEGAKKKRTGPGIYDGLRAGEDAEKVLGCIEKNPSPQTRNSGLALLSRMATLFPAAMASRLRTLLDAVCASATMGESFASGVGGRAALRQTQKAVQSVVPALKAHGAEAGVGAHFVVQVFVDALGDAPVLARHTLFGTLVDSLGDDSLAIMSALLLRRAVVSDCAVESNKSPKKEDDDATTALVEFVHQTVHCSGAQGQVNTLVGLVQACHRLSISTAERSGNLSGQALDNAVDSVKGLDEKADYLNLILDRDGENVEVRKSSPGSAPFMCIDLQSLSRLSESETKGLGGDEAEAAMKVMRKFLERVLAFVRDHLLSRPLLMTVAAAAEHGGQGDAEGEGIQEGFLLLCEELLLLLRTLAVCEHGAPSSSSGSRPSWVALQGLAYAVFETLQSLLSVPSFVAVTQELLQHQDPHLRRKALQMFTSRLDPAGGAGARLSPGEEALFVDMVPSLRHVAMGNRSSVVDDNDGNVEEVMGKSRAADTMDEGVEGVEEESAVNRQTALLSLDVLARVLGRRHQAAFVGVLDDVTEVVAGEGPCALPPIGKAGGDGVLPLRASAFLLLATLCAVLGVRAFPRLPRFFPAMLNALESQPDTSSAYLDASPAAPKGEKAGGQSLLWTSALSAVATVAASLPSFLNPYLGRIMAVSLRPAGISAAAGKQAADRVLSLLSSGVEPRLLIPAVCGAYAGCVEGGKGEPVATARLVARLLAYVQEIVAGLEKEAASAALPQFTRLLTQTLDFRRLHASGSAPEVRASADIVETESSSALVSLVMRLSEVELRPLFLHLCEWKSAVSGDGLEATLGTLDRSLSFYRVLDGLAAALKSIFTPYFAHVLTECCDNMEAASLLATTDPSSDDLSGSAKRKRADKDGAQRKRKKKKSAGAEAPDGPSSDEEEAAPATVEERWRRSAVSRLVVSALRRCFQSDRSGFVNKARFDLLMPAVVSQLECGSGFSLEGSTSSIDTSEIQGVAVTAANEVVACRLHAEELVGPCLAQLASASGKDAMWKALANAVLMRTRSGRAGVRVAALVSLRQCFEVVGEEFLALLPECLPFLSELLEDGHPEVESECRALVKYIEGVLGESIESYLV